LRLSEGLEIDTMMRLRVPCRWLLALALGLPLLAGCPAGSTTSHDGKKAPGQDKSNRDNEPSKKNQSPIKGEPG
jgi:hypothetical protein